MRNLVMVRLDRTIHAGPRARHGAWVLRSSRRTTAEAALDVGAGAGETELHGESFFVYILASQRNGTLYIGVTSDLVKRVWQHREKVVPGFTKTYGVDRLVWFEQHPNAESAIGREKRLKTWLRKWKIELIEETNPEWDDLFDQIARP